MAVDTADNIYLADIGNDRIRKITTDGIIHTIAGTGTSGYNGDSIPATDAQLFFPTAVAADRQGNVYIADWLNRRVRKITPDGYIHTIAGTGIAGFTPDGARADTAAIGSVYAVHVDPAGNVFFADTGYIRKINVTNGLLSTIVGNGLPGSTGDGGPATNAATTVTRFTIDSMGNLYLAEASARRIRKVSTEGIISTIAGTGLVLYNGEGLPPLSSNIGSPNGIAFNPITGELYFADKTNGRIRKITHHWAGLQSLADTAAGLQVFPNPAHDFISISWPGMAPAHIEVFNEAGTLVAEADLDGSRPLIMEICWPPGAYIVRASCSNGRTAARIIAIQ